MEMFKRSIPIKQTKQLTPSEIGNFILKSDRKTGFCIMYSPCFNRVSIDLYTGGTK